MFGRSVGLTEVLYRLSLEDPGLWMMMIGPNLNDFPPYQDVTRLGGFITGYQQAMEGIGQPRDDGFWSWLRDEARAWPQEGWERSYLKQSNGDHTQAMQMLFDQVHR